jgi:hypothetical protein
VGAIERETHDTRAGHHGDEQAAVIGHAAIFFERGAGDA